MTCDGTCLWLKALQTLSFLWLGLRTSKLSSRCDCVCMRASQVSVIQISFLQERLRLQKKIGRIRSDSKGRQGQRILASTNPGGSHGVLPTLAKPGACSNSLQSHIRSAMAAHKSEEGKG